MERTKTTYRWPDRPLNVVLVEPKIPPNTGNIARLCAATGSLLHLVEPLGFTLVDASLRRAGLDYWDSVHMTTYPNLDAFLNQIPVGARLHLLSTRARHPYTEARFAPGDYLVFGSETEGLPQSLLDRFPKDALNIPILLDHVRSLNLSSCAAIVVYEALRQIQTRKNNHDIRCGID